MGSKSPRVGHCEAFCRCKRISQIQLFFVCDSCLNRVVRIFQSAFAISVWESTFYFVKKRFRKANYILRGGFFSKINQSRFAANAPYNNAFLNRDAIFFVIWETIGFLLCTADVVQILCKEWILKMFSKRFISLLLAVLMVASLFPVYAFAASKTFDEFFEGLPLIAETEPGSPSSTKK